MDECSILRHHSTEFSVAAPTESIDCPTDTVNVYGKLETGERPEPSMSVFATQQFIAGFLVFMSETTTQ